MPRILLGRYQPDIASVSTADTSFVRNVVPRSDGYGPLRDIAAFTNALPSPCLGVFGAIQKDGSTAIFAGTQANLYRLNATTRVWESVSKAGGYNVSTREVWSFRQFGEQVIAVTSNNNPQVYTLGSSTLFDDLGGSPPQARRVEIVGDFVVLVSLTDNPNRIHWSGLNNPTYWTPGSQSCDFQQFPDGGFVRGMSGGEFGLVFQDTAIRRMVFAPGSPEIFQFQRLSEDRGIIAPNSIAKAHSATFFLSQDGFYKTDASGALTPIGANRVNATFLKDADLSDARFVHAYSDPTSTRVFWFYKSNDNGDQSFMDKALIYDWSLDRWSHALLSTTGVAPVLPVSATLESLDGTFANIDAMSIPLDSFVSTPTPSLAVMNRSGQLCYFTGSNLEATLDSPEGTIGDGTKVRVRGVAPITDAGAVFCSMKSRDRLMDGQFSDVELQMSPRTGVAPQRSSGRFQTVRMRIPYGTSWTYVRGVEADTVTEGLR